MIWWYQKSFAVFEVVFAIFDYQAIKWGFKNRESLVLWTIRGLSIKTMTKDVEY